MSFYGSELTAFWHHGIVNVPAVGVRRQARPQNLGSYARSPLTDDPIGAFALTLTNLVAGSAIQIETVAGAVVEYRAAGSATEVFALDAFTFGSADNDLRIKVRKGSAPYYKPFETLATAIVGAQSIYIAQIPD